MHAYLPAIATVTVIVGDGFCFAGASTPSSDAIFMRRSVDRRRWWIALLAFVGPQDAKVEII